MRNKTMQIKDLAYDLTEGRTRRIVCPSCGGGSEKERSMSIMRKGLTIIGRCFRATCENPTVIERLDGEAAVTAVFSRHNKPAKHTRRENYDGPVRPLSDGLEQYLAREWGIHGPILNLLSMTDDGRLLIPIRDADGVRRGDLLRQRKPYSNTAPKSVSYYEEGYDGMLWFFPWECEADRTGAICLVEDPISAMRLAMHGVVGVCLNGVNLSHQKVRAIRKYSPSHRSGWSAVNLALDADAHLRAVQLHRKYRNLLMLVTHKLYRDIKDMNTEELRNFLDSLVV